MQNRNNLITILLLFIFSISCTKGGSNNSSVAPIVTAGNWHVSLFSERTVDETSSFSGYSFTFQSNGKLIASKAGINREGTWSEQISSGKLIIDLGPKSNSNDPLGQLTDDWTIIAKSDSKISLTDDNASRNELLDFSKN